MVLASPDLDLTAYFSILSINTYPVVGGKLADEVTEKWLGDVFRTGSHLTKEVWELRKTEKCPLPSTISTINLPHV